MFLTFLCDINLWLIEGPHLLLAPVTSVFISAAQRGEGRGGQTYPAHPAPLAVVTSTGLLAQCKALWGGTKVLAG